MLGTRQSATESPSWACFRAADPHKIPIDPNGNLTTKTEGTDNWVYIWNAENQLTKVEKNSVEVARFSYDPGGRRVEKVAGGVTTSYAYDRDAILRETRGGSVLSYVNGDDLDEPLAVDDGTGLSHFHVDGLGSIIKRTNIAGAVTLTREYDAWGNLASGAAEAGYAFTGREWDPETQLYYYRARYYDPKVARFSSEDPLGIDGGPNSYVYADGDPIDLTDPLGLTGKGERGRTGKPSGTGNEFKHMKPHPNDPNKVKYRDPHTGKEYDKPKPPGFDEWWDAKHRRENVCEANPNFCVLIVKVLHWYMCPPPIPAPPPIPPPPVFPPVPVFP